MGLFDSIAGQLGGALSGSQQGNSGNLMQVVLGLLNSPQVGGIQGLLKTFQEKGMGDAVSSWIGPGRTRRCPVSRSSWLLAVIR
ncbi:MAG: YidB family protein [Propionivibrio sp.]